MQTNNLAVEKRESTGSGAAHKLRRVGRIPAVLYGAGKDTVSLTAVEKEVSRALDAGTRIFELDLGGNQQQALLKAVQYDHLGDRLVHADFLRLVRGEKIEVRVPVVFKGTPAGLNDGGVQSTVQDSIQISCVPSKMPKEIEADISGLALGEGLHVSDVKMPAGVEVLDAPDTLLVSITQPDEEAEAAAPEEGQAEPEVIGDADKGEGSGDEGGKKD